MEALIDTLTIFISEKLLMREDGARLAADEDLLVSGLLDSIGVMRLVGFIETDLNQPVPPEDVTLENFSTVRAMVDYLSALSGARG
jgi:acyl carrier protein